MMTNDGNAILREVSGLYANRADVSMSGHHYERVSVWAGVGMSGRHYERVSV